MPKKTKEKILFEFKIKLVDSPDHRAMLKSLIGPDESKVEKLVDTITSIIFSESMKNHFINDLKNKAHELNK